MTANVRDWFVLNASPELRPQIKATLAPHPAAGLRSSPISGVVVTGRDIDAVAGLLHLRSDIILLLCKNDPDKSVDLDERLTITAIEPGRYDIKLGNKKGRVCVVRSVEVKSGRLYASDKDPIRCEP